MIFSAEIDARIWQAVIAGAFVAAGWLVNGWSNRRRAQRLRDEQLRDAHRALFAEIATYLTTLWDSDALDDLAAETIDRMRRDPGFVPFVPRERADRLYESVIPQIHVLPRVTIDPVVRYYSIVEAIAALAEDMRSDRFASLETERRIAIYRDYIEMRKQALHIGRIANTLIAVYASEGRDAAEREARAFSSSPEAPSAR